MMNEMNIKKMEELMTNVEFADKIENAGSYENAHKLFVEEGVAVSFEEYMELINSTESALKEAGHIGEDGELGPELLELVSGGGIAGKLTAIGTWVVAGVAWYVCPPVGVVLLLAGGAAWNS